MYANISHENILHQSSKPRCSKASQTPIVCDGTKTHNVWSRAPQPTPLGSRIRSTQGYSLTTRNASLAPINALATAQHSCEPFN